MPPRAWWGCRWTRLPVGRKRSPRCASAAGGKAARCKAAGAEVEAMHYALGMDDVAVIADLPRQAKPLKYRPPGG